MSLESPTADVVVLGGGLAGLAAAVTLARAGVDVRLLEARQRVGGRVFTLREPFVGGLYAEGGGEFISPGHEVLRQFLRRYGLPTKPRAFGPRTFYFRGRARRGWSLDDYGGRLQRDAARLARASLELGRRVPDPNRAWAGPDAVELDARSLGDWLDELKLDPLARAHQEVWTTIDYGVEADQLSLLMYARDERMIQQSPERPTECAFGGIDRLPRAMAAELGPRVSLGRPAAAIEQDARGVTVHVGGDSSGRIVARLAVVALPFGVLRSLMVSPPFDPPHRELIEELRYGHVLKVLLQFRHRFWRECGVDGVLTDLPFKAAYDATQAQPGERGILTIYTAGRAAAELAALAEAQRLARCLEQLEQIFPGCGAELERGVSAVWDTDPAALGGYSHFRPGELTRYGPLLAQPQGRIHFAGEHTDPWQATMNGALASGLRAAGEVLTRLNRLSS